MENKFTEEQINEIFLDAVEKCEKLFCTGQLKKEVSQRYLFLFTPLYCTQCIILHDTHK